MKYAKKILFCSVCGAKKFVGFRRRSEKKKITSVTRIGFPQTRSIIEQLQYLVVVFALWLCQVETVTLSNGDRVVYVEKDKVASSSAFRVRWVSLRVHLECISSAMTCSLECYIFVFC
jgi:hypothetical protein